MLQRLIPLALLVLISLPAALLAAQPTDEKKPLRDLNTHCPFDPPTSLEAWQSRATDLRLQLQVSLGLLPKIELDPVKPNIYGKVERQGYTIEKVTFESLPGFFVTGNLYRPAEIAAGKRVPGILCPHGHWTEARFYDNQADEVNRLLASGAERFENAARNHIQARCVGLARMGCIVFHWDMIGYCDSTQISFDRAHRFAKQPQENEVTEKGWLLFSPLAESHCQSVLGLQSLATQRAVDMLLSLEAVDPNRIAITGASGGGTQSFIGAALDPRISVAFPAVMVSTGMQGGCTCENACLLRTGSGNVEISALIAPRPLGLTAADDWTRTMPQDGYPELKKLYGLLGKEENVGLFPAIHFGHNFNHVSRVSMYGWMNDHLGLGFEKPVLEQDFEVTGREQLTVWDAAHPQPPGGEDFERGLMSLWANILDSQLTGLLRGDQQQVQQLADTLRDGWRVCLGLTTGRLQQAHLKGEETDSGHVELNDGDGNHWMITKLDSSDSAPDLLVISIGEGEQRVAYSLPPASDLEQPLVSNPRLAAAYTYGYNLPEFAQDAQRIALSLAWIRQTHPGEGIKISSTAANSARAAAGVFCLQEYSGAKDQRITLALSPEGFRFAEAESIRSASFLPGSARYWDLPGLVACLNADVELETDDPAAYQRLADLIEVAGGTLQRVN